MTVALVHLLFNLTGICLIYPLRPIRRVPIDLARRLSLAVSRNRMVAVYYLLGVFFVMPLLFVLISRALGEA